MDSAPRQFSVTYYVGIMLAQGGILKILDDQLLFVPRNIEKAMGASDVEIPFDAIKMVEVSGAITESLIVRTLEKPHRFVGSDLQTIAQVINNELKKLSPAASASKTAPAGSCPSCFKPVKPNHNFCPACGSAVRKTCRDCRGAVEPQWKHCAFCSALV